MFRSHETVSLTYNEGMSREAGDLAEALGLMLSGGCSVPSLPEGGGSLPLQSPDEKARVVFGCQDH